LFARTKGGVGNPGSTEALILLHAGEQAGFEILHALGVGKETRQFDKRTLDHASAQAQIAFFKRYAFRAAHLFPQSLAPGLVQFGRVAIS